MAYTKDMENIIEAVAKLMLKIANLEREHENDWPAGQEWEDLAPSSQSTFRRQAREYLNW